MPCTRVGHVAPAGRVTDSESQHPAVRVTVAESPRHRMTTALMTAVLHHVSHCDRHFDDAADRSLVNETREVRCCRKNFEGCTPEYF